MESFFASTSSTPWSPPVNSGANNVDGTEVVDDPMKPKYFAIKKLTPDGPSTKTILKNMVTQLFNPGAPEPPRRLARSKPPTTRVSFNIPPTAQSTSSKPKDKEASPSKGKDEEGSEVVEDDLTADETISSDESAEETREAPTNGDSPKQSTSASPESLNSSSTISSTSPPPPTNSDSSPAPARESRVRQRPSNQYEEEEEEDPYAGNEIVVAMLKEALHIRRAKMAEENDPRITRNMHAIAVELKQMGRYDDAVSLLRDAADLVRRRCQVRLQELSRSIFSDDDSDDEEEADVPIPQDDDASSNGVASFDISGADDDESYDDDADHDERSQENSLASEEESVASETVDDDKWTSALEDEDYVRDVDELSAILMTIGNIYRFREMWNDAARYYGDAVGVLRPCTRHSRKLKMAERVLDRIRSKQGLE